MGKLLLGNSVAEIGDGENREAVTCVQRNADGLVLAGVAHGVVHKVVKRSLEVAPAAGNQNVIVDFGLHGDALGLSESGKAFHGGVRKTAKVYSCRIVQLIRVLKLGICQYFVDKRGQSVGLLDDDLHVVAALVAVVKGNVGNHLGIAFDHRKRRAQIMGNICQEFVLKILRNHQLLVGPVQSVA